MTTSVEELVAPLTHEGSSADVLVDASKRVASMKRAHAIDEAAAQLGVSPATIWKYAKLGRIRLVRIGGRTLMPESVLQDILAHGIE